MHIRNYILLVLASLLFVGCSLEKSEGESAVQQPVELVIRASQGGATRAMDNVDDVIEVGAELAPAADTRTELGPVVNGKQQIYWSTSETTTDKIRVWAKNSAGDYSALNGVEFWLKSYNYDYNTADFTNAPTTRVEKMPSGTYTYYGLYPSPEAVSGTTATFTLPTTQSGEYDGSLDWMWATATGAELIYRPEMNSNSTLPPQPHLDFQHLLHLMRISVPENLLGRDVKRLEITFPQAVVGGTATVNVETGEITWDGQQSNKLTIDLADENLLNVGGYVWVHIKPGALNGEISFQAYDDYGVPTQALSTTIDKTLSAGHITPVNLTIPRSKYDDVTYIEIEETANNLGEAWNTMTLSGHTFVKPFTLDTTNSNVVTPNDAKKYKVAIVAAASSLQNGAIAASYDSPNAIVSNSIKLPQTISNNLAEVDNQVPYLLFEDFSRIVNEEESYGNNSYSSGDERDQPGKSLSQLPGWNAARFWVKPSAMRINVRYQVTAFWASTHYGRLDCPRLSGLKSGKSVNLILRFDAGAYHHKSSSITINSTTINVTTHSISSNPIDGIPTGSKGMFSKYDTTEADFGTKHYSGGVANTYGENDFGQTFPTHKATINSADSNTRICFYPSVSSDSGIVGNLESNVYLDNIKVSIAN